MPDFRREGPRIQVEALCWELVDGLEISGLAVDLSSLGLRIERPYTGGPTRHEAPLQIEVPGIDEVMWAKGDVCFDVVVPAPRPGLLAERPHRAGAAPTGGALGLVRRTGYRIALAAARDLRLLNEFVVETDRANRRDRGGLADAAGGPLVGSRWRWASSSPAVTCAPERRARGRHRPCARS